MLYCIHRKRTQALRKVTTMKTTKTAKTTRTAEIVYSEKVSKALVTVYENGTIFVGFETYTIPDAKLILKTMNVAEVNVTVK